MLRSPLACSCRFSAEWERAVDADSEYTAPARKGPHVSKSAASEHLSNFLEEVDGRDVEQKIGAYLDQRSFPIFCN